MGSAACPDTQDPSYSSTQIAVQEYYAWIHCFGHDGVGAKDAWEMAVGVVTVAEDAEHTVDG